MKKAKGQLNRTQAMRIEVDSGSDVRWSVTLKYSHAEPVRKIPGSLVTKILCERELQLRLTRFVHPPVEQLGFQIA